jgi:hypothetical protein
MNASLVSKDSNWEYSSLMVTGVVLAITAETMGSYSGPMPVRIYSTSSSSSRVLPAAVISSPRDHILFMYSTTDIFPFWVIAS